MSRTDPDGVPYRRRTDDKRTATSRVTTRLGLLLLVLLVLYYMVAATLEVRGLRRDLDAAQAETLVARAAAAEERQDTLERLTGLQTDLDNARAEVASLREQLIQAGITPVSVPANMPVDELDQDPRPQEAAGAPESAPQVQTPPQAAPGAPAPAQPANPAPAAPVPPAVNPPASDPVVSVGGEHLLCILTICI